MFFDEINLYNGHHRPACLNKITYKGICHKIDLRNPINELNKVFPFLDLLEKIL